MFGGLFWLLSGGWRYTWQAVVFGAFAAAGVYLLVNHTTVRLSLSYLDGLLSVDRATVLKTAFVAAGVFGMLWWISALWRRGSAHSTAGLAWTSLIAFLMVVALMAGVPLTIHENNGYEPWTWIEGVSIWPSVVIRAVAVVLTIYFLFRIRKIVSTSEVNLTERFSLAETGSIRGGTGLPGFWRLLWNRAERDSIRISKWGDDSIQRVERRDGPHPVSADTLWIGFIRRGTWKIRCYRSLLLTAAALLAYGCLFGVFGSPQVPYRGFISLVAYYGVLLVSVVLFVWLVFVVVDVCKHCQRMINQLSDAPSDWGPATRVRFAHDLMMHSPAVDEWIDLQWIAQYTDAIGKIIYYPAIILVLFVFARYRGFDHFELNPALVIVLASTGLIALICAVMVRRAAERARSIAGARIVNRLIAAKAPGNSDTENQLEFVLQRVEALRDGAFAPYSQQPVVKAVLLPLGGIGGAALLEYLVLFGV
jgi:hypothetical protein